MYNMVRGYCRMLINNTHYSLSRIANKVGRRLRSMAGLSHPDGHDPLPWTALFCSWARCHDSVFAKYEAIVVTIWSSPAIAVTNVVLSCRRCGECDKSTVVIVMECGMKWCRVVVVMMTNMGQ